jgi:hypothetical protein
MRERKSGSCVNWQAALKQNSAKQTGVKQEMGVYGSGHTYLNKTEIGDFLEI